MLTRSGHLQRALRVERQFFLDNAEGWTDTEMTDTGIPDDRDSLLARIAALELEVQNAND